MPLDLVLVNPPSRSRVYQALAGELAAMEPPLWAAMLAAYVRQKGHSVAIVDAEAEALTAGEAARRAVELEPRLAAIPVYGQQPSASTQVMPAAGAVAAALRDLDGKLPVLLLGGHVAALPERTLLEEKADFVCDGEGFVTLVELLDASSADGVCDLWRRSAGGPVRPARRAPLVTRLDEEIPRPAWDLLPMDRYRAHNWHCLGGLPRSPYASLYTTLGCPYRCDFCCIQAPFRSGEAALGMRPGTNSYRRWSPRAVVDNLELLATRYGVRNVKLADEMFVLDRRHVEGICDLLIERGLDLNLWAYARVDTVNPALLAKLRQAGFRWLALGIEAADEAVRSDAGKPYRQDAIRRAVDEIHAAGIHVIANFIFGLPEDTRASMQATLDLALELGCEFGNFYCAMAYPGSRLYTRAIELGWELPGSWSGYSQHSVDTLPLPTRHLTASEVLRFRDQAFLRYHRDERYLAAIEREFGPEAARQILEMASHELERKHG